jgi:hypothetical protein
MRHCATRATDAADAAQNRIDLADDDLKSTASLALFLAKLPSVGFKKDHPSLKKLRRVMHTHQAASKKAKQ